MKILSWNCNMAFRKKQHLIEEFGVDIAIIQECEDVEKISSPKVFQKKWFGENIHKGIGIFSFNKKYSIERLPMPAINNKWFVPFQINKKYLIIGVWAMNHRKNEVINKIQPTYRTIFENHNLFRKADLVLGDFNNNVCWDVRAEKKYNKGKFSDTLRLLRELKFESAYHIKNNENFGEESRPTHIWRKNFKTTYHIDYCFIKEWYLSEDINYQLIDTSEWVSVSDHYPFIIEFDEKRIGGA